jgi:hypothetical protein
MEVNVNMKLEQWQIDAIKAMGNTGLSCPSSFGLRDVGCNDDCGNCFLKALGFEEEAK